MSDAKERSRDVLASTCTSTLCIRFAEQLSAESVFTKYGLINTPQTSRRQGGRKLPLTQILLSGVSISPSRSTKSGRARMIGPVESCVSTLSAEEQTSTGKTTQQHFVAARAESGHRQAKTYQFSRSRSIPPKPNSLFTCLEGCGIVFALPAACFRHRSHLHKGCRNRRPQ